MWLRRLLYDKITAGWMLLTLGMIVVLPLTITIVLYSKSLPLLGNFTIKQLVLGAEWSPLEGKFGFFSFIINSVYLTLLAFLFSAPVCLLAAIYLTQFASSRLVRLSQPVIDILAGLPSVIYGVWGIIVIVPFVGEWLAPIFGLSSSGYSVLAGSIVLAIMCIPYMLNMLIEVFNTVPIGLKEASLSMGATLWEAIKHVVIRKSVPGIVSAFGLGMAKALGETLAVLMVVGNRVQMNFNPFEAGYPLTALIANNYGEMLSIPQYDSALMFAALLLLIIILCINLFFRVLINRSVKA